MQPFTQSTRTKDISAPQSQSLLLAQLERDRVTLSVYIYIARFHKYAHCTVPLQTEMLCRMKTLKGVTERPARRKRITLTPFFVLCIRTCMDTEKERSNGIWNISTLHQFTKVKQLTHELEQRGESRHSRISASVGCSRLVQRT